MANWLVYPLAAMILINVVASVVVLRSGATKPAQKLLQVALVWVVPIVGAVLSLAFAKSDGLVTDPPSGTFGLAHPGDETTLVQGPGPCGCAVAGGGDD